MVHPLIGRRSGRASDLPERAGRRQRQRLALAALPVLVTLTVVVAACTDDASGIVIRPAADAATSAPSTAILPPPDREEQLPRSDPSPEGEPTDLDDFVEQFGYPPDATFARLVIPALSVDAAVVPRVVGSDGEMPLPAGPADIAWYDLSGWPGLGGVPGQGGNAVFAGHVDYAAYVPYADTEYRGKGVFRSLGELSPGDIIEVEYGGEALRYAVASNDQLSAAPGATDWSAVWSGAGADAITLYTCGGDFDPVTRTYNERTVVRAERVS